jgi:hypothetical protein
MVVVYLELVGLEIVDPAGHLFLHGKGLTHQKPSRVMRPRIVAEQDQDPGLIGIHDGQAAYHHHGQHEHQETGDDPQRVLGVGHRPDENEGCHSDEDDDDSEHQETGGSLTLYFLDHTGSEGCWISQ